MKTIEQIEKENPYDGLVLTIKSFIHHVSSGFINGFDGIGYFHDGENETDVAVKCDVNFLKSYIDKYPYVCWYGK